MKLKNKKIIMNKKIVTIALCALLLVIIGGISYAYFAASVTGNKEAKDVQAYAGTMNLVYDGTFATSAEKMMPGDSHEIQFTVTNTGTLSTSYQVDMIDVINDFEKSEELVYSITSDNGGGQQEETEVPITNSTLIPAVGIEPGVTQNYTLKLKFKETGTDQNYNQNKTFSGKVQINSLENSNYLAARVLANPLKKEADFSLQAPYVPYILKAKSLKQHGDTQYTIPLRSTVSLADDYTFESKYSDSFKMSGINIYNKFDKSTIGKYLCVSPTTNNNCRVLIKIKDVKTYENEDGNNFYNSEDMGVIYRKSTSNNDLTVSSSYTFDAKNGYYILNNPIENVSYGDEYIGYYICSNGNDNKCTTLYRIDEVDGTTVTKRTYSVAEAYYFDDILKKSLIEDFGTGYTMILGTSYSFDRETGNYTLNDTIQTDKISSIYAGYYGCYYDIDQSICTDIFKINNIEDGTTINIDVHKANNYYSEITDFEEYTSILDPKGINDSGIFIAKDDLGTSYYYRGKIDNNYVLFADMIWRIVRINGDGSIRLIKNEKINGITYFNNTPTIDPKYLGYTYDNSVPNVQDGSSSSIKNTLDNWYSNTILNNYQNKIVSGIYCNDTTSNTLEDGSIEYGAKKRIENNNPSLQCPETDKTYGGKYELKVGLLSIDEAIMSGISPEYNSNFYNVNNSMLYMSPYTSTQNELNLYSVSLEMYLSSKKTTTSSDIKPVINLRKDIKFTSGDGTKDNPYVVDVTKKG